MFKSTSGMGAKRPSRLYCPQQAAYKPPEYPYEPLYKALSIMGPEIDFKDTGLVTNQRCLQMLSRSL